MYVAGERKRAPPVFARGDIAELGVYDDGGKPQGTILLGVLNEVGYHNKGVVLECMFLSAEDVYYHWWMRYGENPPDRDRGYYHFCVGPTAKCSPGTKFPRMVHGDRYRNWGSTKLTTKQIPWLKDKVIREGYEFSLSKFLGVTGRNPEKDTSKKKPATKRPEEAEATWAGDEEEAASDEDEEEEEASEASDSPGVKKRIDDLRKELKKAEEEAMAKKKHKKAMKAKKEGKKATKAPAEVEGKKKKKEKHGDDDPGSTPGEKKRNKEKTGKEAKIKRKRTPSVESVKGRTKSEPRKKKKKKESSSEDDEETEEDESEAQELFVPKKTKVEESRGRERDRGPFGGGPPVAYDDDDSDSDSEQSFQKGPAVPAKSSSQQKLLHYTNRYPGRLASRMLLKMQLATARGAVGPSSSRDAMTPQVAMNHIQTILIPSLGQKSGLRTTRELKTLGCIMDHLAGGRASKAADTVAQRSKALERASQEGHWGAAQFLELLPPEGTMLLERDEEMYVTKEYLLEQKLRNYDRQWAKKDQNDKGRGKGDPGKGKNKKGDKSDPGKWNKKDPKPDDKQWRKKGAPRRGPPWPKKKPLIHLTPLNGRSTRWRSGASPLRSSWRRRESRRSW